MTNDLKVKFEMPFVFNKEITFYKWLPIGEPNTIVILDNDIEVKLSFDENCAPYLGDNAITALTNV